MPGQGESDDLPSRRRPAVPPEFAPITPLGGTSPEGAPRRAPGEAPRLRLTASASRRNAPDRATAPPSPPTPEPAPVAAPPEEPAPAPRSRRTALVVGAAGTLVALVVGAFLMWPAEQPGADSVSGAPAAAPTVSEFDPPVALSSDTEYVETEVLDDGDDLLVTHWISTTAPMDRFRVRPPSSPGLADVVIDVEDLVVAADGVPLDTASMRTEAPSALPSAQQLYVRYRLVDAVQRTSSVEGRALATVTSLGIGLEGRSLARTQAFPGGRVMTLACLGAGARAVPESCGTYEEGAWKVTSSAGEMPMAVIAQLDLAITR